MAATPSTMIPLGTKAPDFALPNPRTDKVVTLADVRSDVATVVMFICNHCPFVKYIMDGVVDCANDYIPQGVSFVAISSNDADNYPEDAAPVMKEYAERGNYPFPYLYDESQDIARAYKAACTPDFFIFDKELACAYRGQFDGARPGNDVPVSGGDLRAALDALLAGSQPNPEQIPSIGCNIKWKR